MRKSLLILLLFLLNISIAIALSVSITPANPNDNDNLVCNPSGSYVYKWFKNSAVQSDMTSATISASLTSANDVWRCEIWSAASTKVIYVAGKPIVITNPAAMQGSAQVTVQAMPVIPTNHAPSFVSTPVTTAQVGTPYTYHANANDADGDALTYSLSASPTGMMMDSLMGLISWIPTAAGTSNVVVSVSDGKVSVTQSYSITVSPIPDITAPVITLTGANPQVIEVGTAYLELGATALDNYDGDVSGDIEIDDSDVDTDTVGSYVVTYDVTDANGNDALQVTRTVEVVDTTSPATITGLTAVDVANDSITWDWTDPVDVDFDHAIIYIDNVNVANVSAGDEEYIATRLTNGTQYTINVHTVDEDENENITDVTDSQITLQNEVNDAPVADFTSNAPVNEGTDAIFTDSSTDSDGTVVSWTWDFGDSSTSALQNPTHLYAGNGTYSINLTVIDDNDSKNSTIKTITVVDLGPTANFSASKYVAAANQTIFFIDLSTSPVDTVTAWSWNFNDGTSNSNTQNTNHKFENSGFYNVTLTVTDSDGSQDLITKAIEVKDANLYGRVTDTNNGNPIPNANISFYTNAECGFDEENLTGQNCALDPKPIPDTTTDADGYYWMWLPSGVYHMVIQHSIQVERIIYVDASKKKVDSEMKENAPKNVNFEGHIVYMGKYRDGNKYVMGDTLNFVMFGVNHESTDQTAYYLVERHVSGVDNGADGPWVYNSTDYLTIPADGSKVSKKFSFLIDEHFNLSGRYDIHAKLDDEKWHKIGNFFIMENVNSVTRTPPTVKFFDGVWFPDDLVLNRGVYVNESFNVSLKVEVPPQDGTIEGMILYILPITDPVNCTFAAEGDEVAIKAPGSVITVNNTNYTDEFVANVTNARGKDGCVIHSDFVYDESDNFLANFTVKERYYGAESTLKQVNATIWATEQMARDIWYDITETFYNPSRLSANFSGHFRNITEITGIDSTCQNDETNTQEAVPGVGWYNITFDYRCMAGYLGFEYRSLQDGDDGVGDATLTRSTNTCGTANGDFVSYSLPGATLCEKRIMDYYWQEKTGGLMPLVINPLTAEDLSDTIVYYLSYMYNSSIKGTSLTQ